MLRFCLANEEKDEIIKNLKPRIKIYLMTLCAIKIYAIISRKKFTTNDLVVIFNCPTTFRKGNLRSLLKRV